MIETLNDIAIVTSFFNSHGYRTKRLNYDLFSEGVKRSGGRLVTIECAFGDSEHDLPQSSDVIRVRSNSVMWQKERLISIAISTLPPAVTKIAWVDCEVLFTNSGWLLETARRLDELAVVQPFQVAVFLPRGTVHDIGIGTRYDSFGATFERNPIYSGPDLWRRHGHTGFAWAARREVLEFGLYDACIAGSGDHMMAHAFAGDWESACVDKLLNDCLEYRRHFETWCKRIYPRVRARIGSVPGTLLHLWHGDEDDRRYPERNYELNAFAFDPHTDLRQGEDGCWEWNSNKPDLHRWAGRYFGGRREDGNTSRFLPTRDQLSDRLERARDRACSPQHAQRLAEAIAIIQSTEDLTEAMACAEAALGAPLRTK